MSEPETPETEVKRLQASIKLKRLLASIARLEARYKEIPKWKMGTIVFAPPWPKTN